MTTNHFLVNVPPPPPPPQLSFSSSLFLFPLFSTPYRTELVYISIREQGLELARGRVCVQADSSPHCPTPAHLKWKQQHSAVWSPVSQSPAALYANQSVCGGLGREGETCLDLFVFRYALPFNSSTSSSLSLSHTHTHTHKQRHRYIQSFSSLHLPSWYALTLLFVLFLSQAQ